MDAGGTDAREKADVRRTSVRWLALRSQQVNLLLGVAVLGLVITGLTSWAVGTGWSRWLTVSHATFGMMVLVLTPAKASTSVRRGLRRRRLTRWLSVALGVLVLATVALGLAHSSGVWHGHGYWSALWTHFLLAFLALPLVVWHVAARPSRPRRTDLDRRLLLGAGTRLVAAGALVAAVEAAARVAGTGASRRRATGSYEIGSFDPDTMPTVSWIDDTAPDLDVDDWPLVIAGDRTRIDTLRTRARPVEALLDCTGGWFSIQRWDVVPISELLADRSARSFAVTSATGYRRLFPMGDAAKVFVAVGYDGRTLRRGHGAPVRIVAPGRRGPWWVKWVTEIEPTDRPWWLQLPFPAT